MTWERGTAMYADLDMQPMQKFPSWVPDPARRYLAHTALGTPIRDLARAAGCHASTVLRQVRKIEAQREDALLDAGLRQLAAEGQGCKENRGRDAFLDAACNALRALSGEGTLVVFNEDLALPAIIGAGPAGVAEVVATLALDVAAVLLLRGWLEQGADGLVKRYRITPEGRRALPALVAARESRAAGGAGTLPSDEAGENAKPLRASALGPGAENPLSSLSRRRGSDGQPFLTADLVRAGERLHEDFSLSGLRARALLGRTDPQELDRLADTPGRDEAEVQEGAGMRLIAALRDLGPGLADIALRCCCLREGLEETERRMGWSARSGKVVLRIALQRLKLHYAATAAQQDVMIG